MSISIRIDRNSRQVLADIRRHGQYFRTGIRNALHEIGANDVREIRRLIKEGPKTGIKYRNLPNRSSAQGEPPADQSGKLKNSSDYKVISEYKLEVGEKVPYSVFLEFGTKNMKKREHIVKAILNNQRDTENALYEYVITEIRS